MEIDAIDKESLEFKTYNIKGKKEINRIYFFSIKK